MNLFYFSSDNIEMPNTNILNNIQDPLLLKLQNYLSKDKETILHRQKLFKDILSSEKLIEFLNLLHDKLSEILPLQKQMTAVKENKLQTILYPSFYIE